MHVDHGCEALVESPDDPAQFLRCGILALNQCSVCERWLCGTEYMNHLIACAKCDRLFCQADYMEHSHD